MDPGLIISWGGLGGGNFLEHNNNDLVWAAYSQIIIIIWSGRPGGGVARTVLYRKKNHEQIYIEKQKFTNIFI